MEKVKYTYISKDRIEDGMMQVLLSKDIVYRDMVVIDNAAIGILVEPLVKDLIRIATPQTLDKTIKKCLFETECDTIILNGFDISLDDVRTKYMPMAIEHDIVICINVISNFDTTKNVSVYLKNDIPHISDEEWEEGKAIILKDIEYQIEHSKEKEKPLFDSDDFSKEFIAEFMDFDKALKKLNELDELDDIELLESYTYSNLDSDEELIIHKCTNDNVIISDTNNELLLTANMVDFIVNTLKR